MAAVTLKSRIPQITAELQGKLETVVQSGAESIEAMAKARVPVDEGDLRDAIHTEREPEGVYVVAGGEDVFYGHIIENGSVIHPPRPYLVPSAEAARGPIIAAAANVLRNL